MFVFVAVHELRKSQQMVKTREMSERDAELKAIADEPEIKRYAREKMIVQFATFVLMIPLPSIAIYRLGIWVFLIYIKFVSIVVGAVNIYLPRPMSK